jgi:hypothetical protein
MYCKYLWIFGLLCKRMGNAAYAQGVCHVPVFGERVLQQKHWHMHP